MMNFEEKLIVKYEEDISRDNSSSVEKRKLKPLEKYFREEKYDAKLFANTR